VSLAGKGKRCRRHIFWIIAHRIRDHLFQRKFVFRCFRPLTMLKCVVRISLMPSRALAGC
jgi:hypothetical protein